MVCLCLTERFSETGQVTKTFTIKNQLCNDPFQASENTKALFTVGILLV